MTFKIPVQPKPFFDSQICMCTVGRTESREIKCVVINTSLMWSVESILLAFIKLVFCISTGKSETRLKLNINFTCLFQEVTIYEVLAPPLLASIFSPPHSNSFYPWKISFLKDWKKYFFINLLIKVCSNKCRVCCIWSKHQFIGVISSNDHATLPCFKLNRKQMLQGCTYALCWAWEKWKVFTD